MIAAKLSMCSAGTPAVSGLDLRAARVSMPSRWARGSSPTQSNQAGPRDSQFQSTVQQVFWASIRRLSGRMSVWIAEVGARAVG
ncbi:hypothetical protein [Streptomyces sp. SID13031]|uniref:hypothetical protein n=1 Tax=Streptomyces sp. SID13031 TaxID=2706046 RepID=UPI001EF1E228|nr:hypothetical protein [Streptomyces sp. SID13031]